MKLITLINFRYKVQIFRIYIVHEIAKFQENKFICFGDTAIKLHDFKDGESVNTPFSFPCASAPKFFRNFMSKTMLSCVFSSKFLIGLPKITYQELFPDTKQGIIPPLFPMYDPIDY